ncbi:MAG: DNA polymerase I [Lachnospira sp.]|nr:DNA polymerase I [Lachnospira sp.]
MAEKLILIDGHSILNRAFYGVPDLTNSEGIHTNAMYGFLNIMFRFIDEEKPDYITVAFDLSAPTFRHKEFEAYKGTRKPMLPELKQQVPLMKELLKSMGITVIEKEGYEADDLIGTLAKESAAKGVDVTVVSGDRDLLQLSDLNIKIRIPKTKKGVTEVEDYLPKDVEELYGVTPLEFIDMKALMGDTSDNIPGAPGVGPKTASALIMKYHNIETIFEHIDELTPPKAKKSILENVEQVRMSKFLATIDIHVPVEYSLENCRVGGYYNENSYELFKRYNFKNMLKRFEQGTVSSNNELECYGYFKLIEDFGEAESIFAQAKEIVKSGEYIGISILYEDGVNYGISMCLSEKEIYFIPAAGFLSSEYLTGQLIQIAAECTKRQIYVSNMKNALPLFRKKESTYTEVDEKAFYDVRIAAYLLHPNNENYDYDSLARDYMGATVASRSELIGKASIQETAFINQDVLCKMSCMESYVNFMTGSELIEKLAEAEMSDLFNEMEMPLIFVLYEMEAEGIRVDKEGLKVYGDKLGERIEILEKEIYEEAGETFNVNSPKQLGVILFEKLGMPYGKKTKSGYSTAADVLDKLAPDYPFVKKILEYRQLTKLKSTYADGLAVYIQNDGRIHGKFNQTITATGRISSTDPNLQNIPIRMELGREIRKVFIPEEGYVFLDADYSQIELRILAHMSGDDKLIEAYRLNQDIHRTTASQVFHIPFDEVTKQQRSNAKAVNFGIIYGISTFGLSQDLSISRKEAKEYIEQYFETYPHIKDYIDGLVESAKNDGFSLTMFNRRRDIPELKSSNFMQRSFGERVAMNAPIQGTAADIIKLAMIRAYNGLKNAGLKSRLILQVHDELLVETKLDEVDQVKEILTDAMKNAVELKVPLEIDLQQGNNWFEAH